MGTEHRWFDCSPVLLLGVGLSPVDFTPQGSVLARIWAGMGDAERNRFHQFTCMGDRSERTIELIYQMRAAVNAAQEGAE